MGNVCMPKMTYFFLRKENVGAFEDFLNSCNVAFDFKTRDVIEDGVNYGEEGNKTKFNFGACYVHNPISKDAKLMEMTPDQFAQSFVTVNINEGGNG